MRADLAPGHAFPDLELPDHTETVRSLSELAAAQPLVLCFARGWWCPKEQVRLRNLVGFQDELAARLAQLTGVSLF